MSKTEFRLRAKTEMTLDSIKPDELTGVSLAADRYTVKTLLGEGSMAWVYRAWDSRLGTDVVVKVPKAERATDVEFQKRFRLESQVMVKLTHPHVVKIQDVGDQNGLPFVVMQYLSGGTLKQRIQGPQPVNSLQNWLREMARALDFMHRRGVIHRDVKPANMLFDESGNPFMSDFGLTKIHGENSEAESDLSAAGFVVGTPNYLAPEVVYGQGYDPRTDQYALALCVYHAMTGKPPMEGPTASATMVNQTSRVLPLLSEVRKDFPVSSAEAVQRGLEKPLEKRFDSCDDFASAVLNGLASAVPSARVTGKSDETDSIRTSSSSSAAEPRSVASRRQQTTFLSPEQPDNEEYTSAYCEDDESAPYAEAVLPPRRKRSQTTKQNPGKRPKKKTVKCPGCARQLPVLKIHAGRTGSCIYCHQRVRVTKDLRKAIPLKQNSSADSGNNLVLGEKVFGLNISQRTAAIVAGTLATIILAVTMFLSIWATQKSDAEQLRDDVQIIRSME